jgi:hypothetical protein
MPAQADDGVTGSMTRRFAFYYDLIGGMLSALALGPAFSWIDVSPHLLHVHMSWLFDLRVDPRAIASVDPEATFGGFGAMLGGWGVHTNFAGTWFVNGAATNLVSIQFGQPVRAHMMGIIPVRVRTLIVSAEDRHGLAAALSQG